MKKILYATALFLVLSFVIVMLHKACCVTRESPIGTTESMLSHMFLDVAPTPENVSFFNKELLRNNDEELRTVFGKYFHNKCYHPLSDYRDECFRDGYILDIFNNPINFELINVLNDTNQCIVILRMWSNGPNGINDSGRNDDIELPAKSWPVLWLSK